jgi:hypothetical protein
LCLAGVAVLLVLAVIAGLLVLRARSDGTIVSLGGPSASVDGDPYRMWAREEDYVVSKPFEHQLASHAHLHERLPDVLPTSPVVAILPS